MEHKKTKLFFLIYLKIRCSKLLAMCIKTHLENNLFIINHLIHICKFKNTLIFIKNANNNVTQNTKIKEIG